MSQPSQCPWCAGPLSETDESAYRSLVRDRICTRCDAAVFSPSGIADRAGTTPTELDRSPLCRERERGAGPCRTCGGALDRLSLGWDSVAAVVEVLWCTHCDVGMVPRARIGDLARLLGAAEPMHRR